MTLRILIVDDEAPARARMATLLSDLAEECPHELCGSAGDAGTALALLQSTRIDLVLLDVQMPGMDGIDLARRIAAMPMPPAVVFITAFDDYAVNAFEVRAVDYLLKPVRASRLAAALRRVIDDRAPAASVSGVGQSIGVDGVGALADTAAARPHFSVHERDRVLLVPVDQVLYLKAELKYVTLRTLSREFLLEASLLSLEAQFEQVFVRVHRNSLVARAAIAGVERVPLPDDGGADRHAGEGWQVILHGLDERLPISRRQWGTIKALVK